MFLEQILFFLACLEFSSSYILKLDTSLGTRGATELSLENDNLMNTVFVIYAVLPRASFFLLEKVGKTL